MELLDNAAYFCRSSATLDGHTKVGRSGSTDMR
jgi:hypothetical protein